MGYNITGLLIEKKCSQQEIEALIEHEIEYYQDIDFESATSSDRTENTIDVLQTETGCLIIVELGQIYDISNVKENVIQFMISDVSDTYYFEKHSDGELVRKYITSQGEIAEDEGEGHILEEDELLDQIWEYTENYLQNNFRENMFDLKYKRFTLK